MRKTALSMLSAGVLVALSATTASAQDSLITAKMLKPESAMKAAQGAMADCRAKGYQVAAAVVSREGVLQAFIRDRYAGPHTIETATRKAWTAISFRTDTTGLAENTKAGTESSGVRFIPGAMMVGGGVMIEAGGELVGGIGVSGAPGSVDGVNIDDACARAGIEAIADDLF